jgi:hypothetical protein
MFIPENIIANRSGMVSKFPRLAIDHGDVD